jgi:hypothetical protein
LEELSLFFDEDEPSPPEPFESELLDSELLDSDFELESPLPLDEAAASLEPDSEPPESGLAPLAPLRP